MGAAIEEIGGTLANSQQWWALAWSDVVLRYRRTTLGPLWITAGLATTVMSVGVLYGALFGSPISHYLPYFATGLVIWTFMSASLTEGCSAFLVAASIIRAVPIPPAVHVFRMMFRQAILFGHNVVVIVLLWLVFRWHLDWTSALFIPGLAINVVAVVGAVLALSIVACRFRDIQLIVSTILQLAFLVTPIMWEPGSLRPNQVEWIATINPVFHLIEIVRRPLLGEVASLTSWLYSSAVALACLGLGLVFYARYRQRIAFWV